MKNRPVAVLLLVAIGILAAACTPMRMGLQEATLGRLLEQQARCDQLRKKGFETNAELIDCQNNGNALEKSAGEFASEGARQRQAANKVFWFSLAATAGWRSQRPQGMQDAITYADEGIKICDGTPGIQPGDCAFMYAIPAFIANQSVAITFIDLENQADSAARGKPLTVRQETLQAFYLALQPSGLTRIEDMASVMLHEGWDAIQTSWNNIHKLKGLHQDVVCALLKNQQRIVKNLDSLHNRAVNLSTVMENTGWLNVNFCINGNINTAAAADLNLAPAGADFAIMDKESRKRLMKRAMVHTYCTWQYALQNTESEICRQD